MPPITLLGYPLSTLILYFCFYSFMGWCMESTYCSILERRLVSRGFLHGPVCPIYGVGVLLMILFFRPLADNVLLFYLVSTVTMSAWEYFVGWFLEVTTHMKYWDYSMYRFNLKGRICLWVCLTWGVLSYVCIFWVHPPVERTIAQLPAQLQNILAAILALTILVDALITIWQLASMTAVMGVLRRMGAFIPDSLSEGGAKLRARFGDLFASAERLTRRFRRNYADFRVTDKRLPTHLVSQLFGRGSRNEKDEPQ